MHHCNNAMFKHLNILPLQSQYILSLILFVVKNMNFFLDFKLLPCFECRMFSFGLFPSDCSLNAKVLEHSVRSIFIGE
jgi:hypothetical protein